MIAVLSILRELMKKPSGTTWKRTADCPICKVETLQMKHGYDVNGKLWKGHQCICKSWQCSVCSELLDKQVECCR